MKRLALIAIVLITASSCQKHYTCTCRTQTTKQVTNTESYDHVSKGTAERKCDDFSKSLNPPATVEMHDCSLSK